MKSFVVRSDVNTGASWLKLNVRKNFGGKFDVTDERRIAHLFSDYDEAQRVANDWSDAPGVWFVERV